ncbi:unnamed protein product, partial [Ixodes persulcatus]
MLRLSFLPASNKYTCFNKNHRHVTSIIKSFNQALAAKLVTSNHQLKLRFEDDDAWTEVLPDVFVYSAFLEKGEIGTWQIRLISVVRSNLTVIRQTPQDIKCWVNARTAVYREKVEYKYIPESHGLAYAAVLFTCPVNLPSQVRHNTTLRVALRSHWNATKPKWVKAHKTRTKSPKLCSVCVKPTFAKFNELSLMTEFIGYYTSMGVARFDFYISGLSKGAEVLLSRLKNHSGDLIQLHKWNLSFKTFDIWQNGQLAAIQDCIYRSRSLSEYVIIVDFDEFLVPKKKHTILEALRSIETEIGKIYLGSMVIQNLFFCTEYPYNSAFLRLRPPLLTQIATAREKMPWNHRVRSKYITRPKATVVGGVHFVFEHVPGVRELRIPADEMALHHYRTCCGVEKPENAGLDPHKFMLEQEVEDDKSMHAFSVHLIKSDAFLFVNTLLQ